MPYFWLNIDAAPYPHGMRENHECPFALNTLRAGNWGWEPGQNVYGRLYADPAYRKRAQRCPHHLGDWDVVLPAVASLLASTSADETLEQIADRAEAFPAITELDGDDRHLALALLDWSSPIEVYPNPTGELITTSGQHRICAARIAGAPRVPVWCKPGYPPPPGAVPAQPPPRPQSERGLGPTPDGHNLSTAVPGAVARASSARRARRMTLVVCAILVSIVAVVALMGWAGLEKITGGRPVSAADQVSGDRDEWSAAVCADGSVSRISDGRIRFPNVENYASCMSRVPGSGGGVVPPS